MREPDGPEVVILVTHTAHGKLEAWVMGGNRDRILRRLMKADRFRRFRACYPVITGSSGEREIFMHSKLVIVDDRFLRIGSSNLNRRSMGLDMECDLSIEATDAETERRIARIRARLLGEHLDAAPQAVHAAFVEEGSLIRAIDRLNGKKRRLRRYESLPKRWKTMLAMGSSILDPRVPYPGLSLFRRKRSRFLSSGRTGGSQSPKPQTGSGRGTAAAGSRRSGRGAPRRSCWHAARD